MKLIRIQLTIVSILAAESVFAFPPLWPVDGDNAAGVDPAGGVVIWMTGAAPMTKDAAQSVIISAFCNPDLDANPATNDVDILEITYDSENHWAVACIGKPTLSPNLAGKRILWNMRDGLSGLGVQPLATSQVVSFLKPSTGVGNNCPSITGTRALGGGLTANLWACINFSTPATINEANPTTDAVARIPDLGIAEMDAAKFTYVENLLAADINLDGISSDAITNSIAGLDQADLGHMVFGVFGGLRMIQALQSVQFPLGHSLFSKCNPAGIDYLNHFDGFTGPVPITNLNANANREQCMASLMSSELRGIFSNGRQIRAAGDLQAETALQSGTFSPTVAGAGTTDATIMVCRLVKGSGIQAVFNANILGYPCDDTADGSMDTLLPAAQGALSPNIIQNKAVTGVAVCVDDFNDGTNVAGSNAALAQRWSIGLGSALLNPSLALGFRYFKIDGFAPSLVNVHAGDYTHWTPSMVLLKRTATPSGPVTDAFSILIGTVSSPATLGGFGVTHSWGRSGFLTIPSSAIPPTSELSFTTPINAFRKVSATGKPNACALPSPFRPAAGVDITVAPQNCSSDNNSPDQNCYTP